MWRTSRMWQQVIMDALALYELVGLRALSRVIRVDVRNGLRAPLGSERRGCWPAAVLQQGAASVAQPLCPAHVTSIVMRNGVDW
jgi:hypothetical protein